LRAEVPRAIVTGAAAGIGRAVAFALAARGWAVVAVDLDREGAERVAATAGRGAVAIAADLANEATVGDIVVRAGEDGPLAAVVHCAALFPQIPLVETRVSDFDRVMAVNLRAAVQLTLLAGLAMPDGGAMVFLTSGSGLLAAAADPFQRGFALYGASKAALDRWVAGVAPELAEAGISASTITPGAFVATPGLARAGVVPPPGAATIAAERVAEAIVRLVEDQSGTFAGARLNAAEFGATWC
jgi:NAD(P)-dependent dehydrogenase (short-subunit alcohol dehydrogenase family)